MNATAWFPVLSATLLHSLWQGALVAAVCAVALRHLKTAHGRYLAACTALALLVALPLGTFLYLLPEPASLPPLPAGPMSRPVPLWMSWTSILWMTGSSLMGIRLALSWGWIQRHRWSTTAAPRDLEHHLQTLAARLGLAGIQLRVSRNLPSPMVLGWLRPLVLVPAWALTGLPPAALEQVLAHELAHVLRRDYLVNLVQCFAEALLFYHPAAWWLSRRIRVEREHACDDLAVGLLGDPLAYARALTDLEALRPLSTAEPTLALAATGGHLMNRIRRIILPSSSTPGRTPFLAAAALATLGTGTAWAMHQDPKPAEPRQVTIIENSKRLDLRLEEGARLDLGTPGHLQLGEKGKVELRARETPGTRKALIHKEAGQVVERIVEEGKERPATAEDHTWIQAQLKQLAEAQERAGKAAGSDPATTDVQLDVKQAQGRTYVFRSQTGHGASKGKVWFKGAHDAKVYVDFDRLPDPEVMEKLHAHGEKMKTLHIQLQASAAKARNAAEAGRTAAIEGRKAAAEGRKAAAEGKKAAAEAHHQVIEVTTDVEGLEAGKGSGEPITVTTRKDGDVVVTSRGSSFTGTLRKSLDRKTLHTYVVQSKGTPEEEAKALRSAIEKLQKRLAELEQKKETQPTK